MTPLAVLFITATAFVATPVIILTLDYLLDKLKGDEVYLEEVMFRFKQRRADEKARRRRMT